ncbi:MAG: class II fructose-1,6-bisphosphate aldolase [Bacilli bacterium]
MLEDAKVNKYAVPHFNINNLEWTRYILEECNRLKSPVILGVSEGAIRYMGGYKVVANLVKNLDEELNIQIPVAIHLDHGSSVESCKKAVDAGFTSVMIDASKYSLEENIDMTKQVVEYARIKNITIEAEIGHIGGSEDNMSSEIAYAKVDDALSLYNETKIDFLAPALGSVHGLYKGEPCLDFDKMKEISEKTNIPLVLHGGTGIDDEKLKKAIASGICKVNINTELQIAWTKAVRKFLSEDTKAYDPRTVIKSGEQSMKQAIEHKVNVLGSINRIN